MKIFWKAQILEMAESDTLCVKSGDNHDFANGTWLRSVYPSYKNIFVKKVALQTVLQRATFDVLLGRRLRANGDCKVTKTHLK